MAPRKKKHLVIVESPAKARTINKYLGPDFEVVASKGHVRDLPKSRFGIDIEGGWVPTYRAAAGPQGCARRPQEAGRPRRPRLPGARPRPRGRGDRLAPQGSAGPADDKIRRVTFNEITKSAVQKAFADAGNIDMDLVAAQEARRFLDRVVGYKLSPLLSPQICREAQCRPGAVGGRAAHRRARTRDPGVQAGRVLEDHGDAAARSAARGRRRTDGRGDQGRQGEGEKEDKSADEEASTEQAPLPAGAFLAELAEWDGAKFKSVNEEQTLAVVNGLNGANYVVTKVEQKDRQERRRRRSPPARCSSRRACACASPPSAPCGRPSSSTKAWSWAAKARWPSSPTCVPTARASRTRR